MKELHAGCSVPKFEDCTLIDTLSVNKFCVGTLDDRRFLIDLDAKRVDMDKLKKILVLSKRNIIVRVIDGMRVKALLQYFDKVYYYDERRPYDIFNFLMHIFTSRNNDLTFKTLQRWDPPMRVLLKWIISSLDLEDYKNIELIQQVDCLTEKVDPIIVKRLLSLFDGHYSFNKRFTYRFKKAGE